MIVVRSDELDGAFDRVIARREAVIAIGTAELRGRSAAALMHSDWAVMSDGATIVLDSAEAWSGAVWRIGRRAVGLLLDGGAIDADHALRRGLADAIVPSRKDPLEWIREWLDGRSELALDSAAS